jgi:hypothetical protein
LHCGSASRHQKLVRDEKEKVVMSKEEKIVEEEQVEEAAKAEQPPVVEEIKVQAQDLFQAINDIIREGTAKRVTVMRNDRVLVDIPLVVGVAASAFLAIQMPVISALAAVGALFGGCTVRIEREAPSEET